MASPKDSYNQVKKFIEYNIDFNNINLLALSQIYVFELAQKRLDAKGVLNKLKKYSVDNYVKAILAFFSKDPNKSANSKYLFVNDVNNNSMIENMRAVQKKFDEDFIELITDKRLVNKKSKFIFKNFNFLRFARQIFNFGKFVKSNSKTLSDVSKVFKIKKSLLIYNVWDSFFVLNCVEGFLNAHREIDHIILNSDVHKVSRAIVLLARNRNIKTYVIQHGSTVLEYGYLPVISDYIFTWGRLSNNWFLERGTNENKLITTGTPKMDSIKKYKIHKDAIKKVKNILLILNPIGEKNVRDFIRIVKEANLDTNYNLVIKLHPGSTDNRNIVEEFFKNYDNKIYKKENTHKLIYDSDVVITTTSTVGNETIAFYKPLVQVKIANTEPSLDYEKFNCSHVVQDAKELENLIVNVDRLESKKANYQQFISDYFYSLDGKSAERIRKFIA